MLLAYAFCGSFCTHSRSLAVLEELVNEGHEILPVFSEIVQTTSTRFGDYMDLEKRVKKLTGHEIIKTIYDAELQITRKNISCVVVSPCTGNTLAKTANGITDSVVTMCIKAQLRNNRPVLLALATNDALSTNLKNIGICSEKKNIYFVPMGQDDSEEKPTSMICDFKQIKNAISSAIKGKQLQPFLI
ncbi:dipicolinate synthase subunit B [Eubacteriales bacterium OttesenSCG-928-G02]|nr:dipicolinate synthase subunit B [Eubacteriales bacterium OttesenSCG-928-G02]